MRPSLFFFLSFFYIFTSHLYAIPILQLNAEPKAYTNFSIQYFIEKTEEPQTIDTVQKISFSKTSNKFTFSYHTTPIWLRFNAKNSSNKPLSMILELSVPFHKTVNLYHINSEKEPRINGLSVPLSQRTIKEYNPAFKLDFKPLETKQLYIKLESSYGLFGSIQFKTKEKFYTDTRSQNNFFIFYFGAVLIIALYNLFIFFYLKEKIYLYYVAYVLCFAVWASLYSGFAITSFDMKTYDHLQISVPAFLIMLTLFSQFILQIREFFPKLNKFLNWYIFLILLSLIWMLISLSTGFFVMNVLVVPLLPILLSVSIYASYKGHKLARIYAIALSPFLVGMSIISLVALGFIPYYNFFHKAPIIGSLIEVVLFSLALAYRINLFRQEKLKTQASLLKQEQTESSRLTQMVEEKTAALIEANKQLKIQASTDSLTGILNRKAFFQQCSYEIQRIKRYNAELSFLIIDIDFFKSVNDTYGHIAGDDVIICITKEVHLQLRKTDVFGRIGGEEFAVLMPNTSMEHALQLAQRIRQSVSQCKIIADGNPLAITISIGVSLYDTSEEIIQPTLKRADKALYQAKENGRDQVMGISL